MVVWNAAIGVFLVAWGAVRLLLGPGEWWSYIVMVGGAVPNKRLQQTRRHRGSSGSARTAAPRR
jgi:hypothetical protein